MILTHVVPLFICWSSFAYGLDFAEIFKCATNSTLSRNTAAVKCSCGVYTTEADSAVLITLQSQTHKCHWHLRVKYTEVPADTAAVKCSSVIDMSESDSAVLITLQSKTYKKNCKVLSNLERDPTRVLVIKKTVFFISKTLWKISKPSPETLIFHNNCYPGFTRVFYNTVFRNCRFVRLPVLLSILKISFWSFLGNCGFPMKLKLSEISKNKNIAWHVIDNASYIDIFTHCVIPTPNCLCSWISNAPTWSSRV